MLATWSSTFGGWIVRAFPLRTASLMRAGNSQAAKLFNERRYHDVSVILASMPDNENPAPCKVQTTSL